MSLPYISRPQIQRYLLLILWQASNSQTLRFHFSFSKSFLLLMPTFFPPVTILPSIPAIFPTPPPWALCHFLSVLNYIINPAFLPAIFSLYFSFFATKAISFLCMDTSTVSPASILPERISSASPSSILFWIILRNGRAPYFGS